ncbi:MAG: KH domain-containing protein [Anaerolineales bacterium]
MKELVEYLAKSLVTQPDHVRVEERQRGRQTVLTLSVSKEDMGRIIGKQGRVVQSLRTLLRVAAEREGKQVTLDVLEP